MLFYYPYITSIRGNVAIFIIRTFSRTGILGYCLLSYEPFKFATILMPGSYFPNHHPFHSPLRFRTQYSLSRNSLMGGGPEGNGWGTFLHWGNHKFLVFSNSKIFRKWKFYNLMKILKEILRLFWSLSKFSRKFREKFGNMDL